MRRENKLPGMVGTCVREFEGRGGSIRQHPTFPREQQPARPVACVGAEGLGVRVARIGLAPEKSEGTDGAGPRSQGPALLGEVEPVPRLGKAGSVSLGWTRGQSSGPLGSLGGGGAEGCGTFW